jgi:nuclear transport factor 2 (NTF2) superfamily protein
MFANPTVDAIVNATVNATVDAMAGIYSPLPYFTLTTAKAKVQASEDAWNRRNPDAVVLAYTADSEWRDRSEVIKGHDQIRKFLARKWKTELDYRLKHTLISFMDNCIVVRCEYEYHTALGQWYRAYGNENWEFSPNGQIQRRKAIINTVPIKESERKFCLR